MTRSQRMRALEVGLGLLLAGLVGGLLHWRQARLDRQEQGRLWEQAQKAAHTIASAQQRSVSSQLTRLSESEIQERLLRALAGAGLSDRDLSLPRTAAPVRVESTDYQRQFTTIKLSAQSLGSFCRLLRQLQLEFPQQITGELRLLPVGSGPAAADQSERWTMEITLTQIIYDPILARSETPGSP